MTAVPATAVAKPRANRRVAPEEMVVLAVLVSVALLAAALVALSLLPSATLAARLMGSVGEVRAGTFAQELATSLSLRLRLAGGVLLALVVATLVLRHALQDLVASAIREWPALGIRFSVSAYGVAASVLALLGLVLRLVFLQQPMRYDEALSFNEFASRPLYYALSFYPEPNNHLLNTLLVNLLHPVLGSDAWVLRLPAVVAGVLLVPATYGLGRRLATREAALLAAGLVAASSYLVEFSTNSRGYTLQALCFVLALSLAIVAVRDRSLSALLGAAFVLAIGAYAIPTMLYGIAVIGGWLALELARLNMGRPAARHVLAAALVIALASAIAYLPVIIVSGPEKLVANRFVVPLGLSELIAELPRTLARTFELWHRDVPGVVVALLAVGFVVASAQDLRRRRLPLGLLAFAVCLALVVLQRVAPFERVWLFLLPLYFVLASGGLVWLVSRWSWAASAAPFAAPLTAMGLGLLTISSGAVLQSDETGAFPDAEAVAQTLSNRLHSEDAVLTAVPASLPELQYYFPRYGLPITSLVRLPQDATRVYVVARSAADAAAVTTRPVEEVARLSGSFVYRVDTP
jgi:hypothetical protein